MGVDCGDGGGGGVGGVVGVVGVRKERGMSEHIGKVCRIGQGHDCCRYLMMGSGGFECAKLTGLKGMLDRRVEEETITARGDNCDGKESLAGAP